MGSVVAKRKLKDSYYKKNGINLGSGNELNTNGLYMKNTRNKQSKQNVISKIKNKLYNKFIIQLIATSTILVFLIIINSLNLKIINNAEIIRKINEYSKKNYTIEEIKDGFNNIKYYTISVLSPIIPDDLTAKSVEVFKNLINNSKDGDNNVIIYEEKQANFNTFQDIEFCIPTSGTITSEFGKRKSIRNEGEEFHYGIDIANQKDTTITSSIDGEVVDVGYDAEAGNYIKIKSGDIETRYYHLNNIFVNKLDNVCKGQKIASMGDTGNATGTHLHFEVRYNNEAIDPKEVINFIEI